MITIGLIWDIIYSIFSMLNINQFNDTNRDIEQTPIFILSLMYFLFMLFIASILTFKTNSILRLVNRQYSIDKSSDKIVDIKTVLEIVLTCMGLLLIIWTFPDIENRLESYIRVVLKPMTYSENYILLISRPIINIGFGILTIYYSKAISVFLTKDRDSKTAI